MATYVIGDVHGCLPELESLLHIIAFSPEKDQLWFVGDLVNRGKYSLETLRFIRQFGFSAIIVLGNHDLHLMSLLYRPKWREKFPLLQPIFSASDGVELLQWLRSNHLFYYDGNQILPWFMPVCRRNGILIWRKLAQWKWKPYCTVQNISIYILKCMGQSPCNGVMILKTGIV